MKHLIVSVSYMILNLFHEVCTNLKIQHEMSWSVAVKHYKSSMIPNNMLNFFEQKLYSVLQE